MGRWRAGALHAGFSLYWALGGQWLLATVGHWAVRLSAEAPVAAGIAFGLVARVHEAKADGAAVPQVTFTIPEVASVGLAAAAAEAAGYAIRVVDYDIGRVSGAGVHATGYIGTARMVVNERRHTILGVTFVGQDVAELLHAATIAIVGEVPLERLWHAVPAYPTISEVWLRLLETYGRPTSD